MSNNFVNYGCNQPNTINVSNSGFNYGMSTRQKYQQNESIKHTEQSTAPILSMMDPNRIRNCNQCFSPYIRPSQRGWGDNLAISDPNNAPAQQLVDIDSVFKNMNLQLNRDGVNPVNVFNYKTYDNVTCNNFLNPVSSYLSFGGNSCLKEQSINRFYDLNINPQVNIFYDWAHNTQLEAKDNYNPVYPYMVSGDYSLPSPKYPSTENFSSKQPVLPTYPSCGPMNFDSRTYPYVNSLINPAYTGSTPEVNPYNNNKQGYQTDSDEE